MIIIIVVTIGEERVGRLKSVRGGECVARYSGVDMSKAGAEELVKEKRQGTASFGSVKFSSLEG